MQLHTKSIVAIRLVLIASALVFVAFLMPVRVFADTFPTSGQFDQVTSITAPRVQLKFVQTVKFKGTNIRIDWTDPSQYIPLTRIQTTANWYLYSPLAGNGEEAVITTPIGPLLNRMATDTKSKIAAATKAGTVTYEGYSCTIYKTSEQNGTVLIEFWVSNDPKFPFTLKTIATDATLQKVTTVDLENISLNTTFDDSLFQVPASIKLSPAGSPNQSQGAPPGNQDAQPSQNGSTNSSP